MVVRAYAVCIGVTPECRRTESEMIGDGRGHVDEAYHDTHLPHIHLHVRAPRLRSYGMFINRSFMQKHQLETTPLPQPVLVRNVDGSPNVNRSVMEEVHVTLRFGRHSERAHLAVANLRQQTVIIGHSWLTLHNPEVDCDSQKVSMT